MLAKQIIQNLNNCEQYRGLNNSSEQACLIGRIHGKKSLKNFVLNRSYLTYHFLDVPFFRRCQKWHCSVARKILKNFSTKSCVGRTFQSWSEQCLLPRSEMATTFRNVDLCFRFTINGAFSVFFIEQHQIIMMFS